MIFMVSTKTSEAPEKAARAGLSPDLHATAGRLRALRAAFFREFWPFFPLAIALIVLVGLVAGLMALNSGPRKPDPLNILMQINEYLPYMVAGGCALMAFAIGVCQARADRGTDVWGFVIHRAASRTLLFAGRVLAGLVLYGIAAGVPLAVLLMSAASRAGGIPFDGHMVLAPAADFFTGVVYYFAGWLVVERQASIFGSRVVPVVGAVLVSIGVVMVRQFSGASAIAGVAVVIYGIAAWGGMYSNGFRVRAPRMGWMGAGGVLFLGFSGLLVLANCFLMTKALMVRAEEGDLARDELNRDAEWGVMTRYPKAIRNIRYLLLPDGTLGRRSIEGPLAEQEYESSNNSNMQPLTSDGGSYVRVGPPDVPVKPDWSGWAPEEFFPESVSMRPLAYGYRACPSIELRSSNSMEDWYYLPQDGIAKGYNIATHAYLGAIGRTGFAAPGNAAVPFANGKVDEWGTHRSLQCDDGIYDIDCGGRTATPEVRFPSGVRIVALARSSVDPRSVIVFTERQMYLYAPGNPQPQRIVPFAISMATARVRVTRIAERHRWVVWYSGRGASVDFFDDAWKKVSHAEIAEVEHWDLDGAWPVRSASLQAKIDGLAQKEREMQGRLAVKAGMSHALCDLPFLRLAAWAYPAPQSQTDDPDRSHRPNSWLFKTLDTAGYPRGAYFGGAAVSGVVLGVVMFFLARRLGTKHPWLWGAGALVFGLVAVLVLLAVRAFPRRVKCGDCGSPRFTSVARCRRCQMVFAGPVRNGTEIFMESTGGAA